MHLDEEAAAKSMLRGLSGSGWHLCSLMMRMMADGFITRAASLGSPGVDEVRWLVAVAARRRPHARRRCRWRRAPRRAGPRLGIVKFKCTVRNAAGQALCEMTSPILIKRREGAV